MIVLEGELRLGDEYRSRADLDPGALYVGNHDLVRVLDTSDLDVVRFDVNSGEKTWEGQLYAEQGFGDQQWNPGEPDVLEVGDVDIINALQLFVGDFIRIEVEGVPQAR